MEISTEYNSNWNYSWFHNGIELNITSHKLYSIGKDVSGEYMVKISNNCDTIFKSINVKKKIKSVYFIENGELKECQQSIFTDEWHEKLDSHLEFIAFPNPTKQLVNVRIYRGQSDNYLVNVYDQLGKIILTKSISKEDQIDISNLSPGVYILEVTSDTTRKCEVLNIQ